MIKVLEIKRNNAIFFQTISINFNWQVQEIIHQVEKILPLGEAPLIENVIGRRTPILFY